MTAFINYKLSVNDMNLNCMRKKQVMVVWPLTRSECHFLKAFVHCTKPAPRADMVVSVL